MEDNKVKETMISFAPLHATLHELGKKISELRTELKMAPATVARLGKDEYISLENAAQIAAYLKVPLHKVVELKPSLLEKGN